MDKQPILEARVKTIAGGEAWLAVGTQQLRWPSDGLPEGVKEGDTVSLCVVTKEQTEVERQERARALLTEILGGGS